MADSRYEIPRRNHEHETLDDRVLEDEPDPYSSLSHGDDAPAEDQADGRFEPPSTTAMQSRLPER